MRTVLVILSGLVVFSGIVSAKLWSDLRAERLLTADLQTQLTAAKLLSHVVTPPAPPVAAVPDIKRDPPPAIVPPPAPPAPPATSMNQRREILLSMDEPSKPEKVVVDTGFAVNQSGRVMAKPSNIMMSNDLNKDGVVTKEEATTAGKALIRLWNAYDLNKDDVVDDAEIAKASGM